VGTLLEGPAVVQPVAARRRVVPTIEGSPSDLSRRPGRADAKSVGIGDRFGAPWTAGERQEDQELLEKIAGDFSSRGMLQSGAYEVARQRALSRVRRRRSAVRVLAALVIVVVVLTVCAEFTDNRFVTGIRSAAAASAAPIALLLGYRR
jgi:hypothetical protein